MLQVLVVVVVVSNFYIKLIATTWASAHIYNCNLSLTDVYSERQTAAPQTQFTDFSRQHQTIDHLNIAARPCTKPVT
jgi:hypothetical protein